MASTVKLAVAVVLLVYLYARLQHGWYLEEPRDAQMVRMGSKVVASDLLKRGRLWRDVTRGGERQRHNSLTNRPHWFLDSLLLLAGDIELNPGPVDTVVQQHDVGDLALLLEPIAADRDLFVRQLGVPYTETETIAAEKRGYRHYALIDALQYWVNVSATPTYEQISQVLRGAFVTNFPLAKKVEEFAKKKRQTQSLPVGGGVDPASRGPQRYTTGDVMEQMKISEPWKRSLQELRSRLAETIESRLSPDRFGDALVGKGFISEPAKRDRVNVLGVTGYSKIAGLLDAVSTDINNAGNKPKRFNDFVAILNSLGLRDAEQELTECYRKYDPGYMYVDRAERKGGDVMEQMKISEPWKRSLQELGPRLAETIESRLSPDRFGDALGGKRFVTEEIMRDRVNVLGVTDYSKIASLLVAVSTDINSARNNVERFDDFVAILNDLELRDVGKELTECYRKYDPGYMYVDRAERKGETGVHVEPEAHDLHEREVRFKAAMENGHVNLRVSTVFLHGPAGSGKTCSGCFLVGEEPPPESERESTAVARPMRIFCVDISKKDSSSEDISKNDRVWKKLSTELRLDNLVKTMEIQQGKKTQPNVDASQLSIEQSKESHNEVAESITSEHVKESSIVHEHSEPPEPSQTTPVDDIPKLKIADDIAKLIENHSKSSPIELDMMHIIDTGGQPQCHELLRYFVKRQTSLYIFVFKLSEKFSITPQIAYHVNGKCVSGANCGKQTIEEILQQCVRTIKLRKHADVQSHTGADMQSSTGDDVQSHKPDSRKFQILFLGTHKDKEGSCEETRDTKNEKLRNLVFPKFQGHTYLYDDNYPVKLIVPVDVSPLSKEAEVRKEEKTIFDNIRNYITKECPLEPVNVPLRYYGLEILLEQLSVTTNRKVLKWSECLAASKQLHFSEHVFEDAIRHLDDHCLIFHYRNVKTTPWIDIVFTDIQVLLDKVSELVQASCDNSSSGGDGWKEFRDYGRVTLKLLSQKRFEKHYKSGFFTAEDLIELFRDFFVFADLNRAEHKYFVPALLGTANHDELEQYRSKTIIPSAATLSPLVLLFPNGGPQLGVFCYLIAYLLSSENMFPSAWELKMKDDKITPECLKRNCVVFSIPEIADSVSLIDSFHHLEVHVNAFTIFRASDCTIAILQALGEGLSKASEKLSYNEDLPEISIACPCEKGDLEFHHATFYNRKSDDYCWICSKYSSIGKELPKDFAWLTSHRAVSGKTSMPPKLTAPGTGDASAHAPLHPTTTPEGVPPDHSQRSLETDTGISGSSSYVSTNRILTDFCSGRGLANPTKDSFSSSWWNIHNLPTVGAKTPIIAILDTGINQCHAAFTSFGGSKVIASASYIAEDASVQDTDGHGTACAAIAAGFPFCIADRVALGGVASEAKLIICRVASRVNHICHAPVSAALQALIELNQKNKTVDGIPYVDVVSMSFFTDDIPGCDWSDLLSDLRKQGTICVAAAGNSGNREHLKYPAFLGHVISVGSHTDGGKLSDFSRDGADVYALGENVCVPDICFDKTVLQTVNGTTMATGLGSANGTSVAAPAVAGLIARLIEYGHHHFGNDNTKLQWLHNSDMVVNRILKFFPMRDGLILHPRRFFDNFGVYFDKATK